MGVVAVAVATTDLTVLVVDQVLGLVLLCHLATSGLGFGFRGSRVADALWHLHVGWPSRRREARCELVDSSAWFFLLRACGVTRTSSAGAGT